MWTIVAVALAGCGGGSDKADGGGAAAGDGAEIELDRSPIDFGALEGAESRTEVLAIRNAGSADLHVAAAIEGDGAFAITGALPAAIPPMTTEELAITFQPAANGEAEASLVLQTDDRDSPQVALSLSGAARFPVLGVGSGDSTLGEVYVGCETYGYVYLENRGSADLVVDSVSLDTEGGFSLQSFEHDPPPWTLAPGDSRAVYALFAPLAAGVQTATLVVASNDPVSPTTEAALVGEGVLADEITQTWVIPEESRMAVLIAANIGGTMPEHLPGLAVGVAAMAEALDAADVEFRIGIVAEDSGEICGDVAYIYDTIASDAQAIAEEMLGLGDAPCEPGEDAARTFSLLEAGLGANASWHTEGTGWYESVLHLVGVSNEVEQSPWGWSDFVEQSQELRADPGDVAFHAIGGDYSWGCEDAAPYTGFYEAVDATGGLFLSICADDWAATGAALGEAMAVRDDRFALPEQPVVQTLAVTVDGVAQPDDRWRYDPADNAVLFEPGYGPAGGSAVKIRYSPEADCN